MRAWNWLMVRAEANRGDGIEAGLAGNALRNKLQTAPILRLEIPSDPRSVTFIPCHPDGVQTAAGRTDFKIHSRWQPLEKQDMEVRDQAREDRDRKPARNLIASSNVRFQPRQWKRSSETSRQKRRRETSRRPNWSSAIGSERLSSGRRSQGKTAAHSGLWSSTRILHPCLTARTHERNPPEITPSTRGSKGDHRSST